MIEDAFPLYWPEGQPRCSSRRDNWAFKVTFWQALQHLRAELVRMGAKEVIVSSSVPLRKGGEVRPWWEVLGVTPTATPDQVKGAYRSLASVHHPDSGGDAETMSRLNVAYETYQRGAK